SPDDRPALDAAIDAAISSCGDFRAEYRVLWPDGQVRWISARGRAQAGADGAATNLLGTAHDITEVRSARDRAAELLESMATGFVSMDRNWRITYLNEAGSLVVGYTREQLVGQDLWAAFPGLSDLEFGRQYRHAMATGETAQFEAYYPHLDGWFDVRAVPNAEGLALYFLDISARKADQEQAEAATRRVALLAAVSAELAAARLDIEEAVARLGELVTPVLADWCVVSLVDGDGIRDVGCWHADPELREVVEEYVANRLVDRRDLGAVQQVRETSDLVVQPSGLQEHVLPMLGSPAAREAWLRLEPESVVTLPLMAHDTIVGILALVRGRQRPPMSDDELMTAREVASRVGLALDNARLYAAQRSLAEGLQRSLLTTPPEPDHCEIVVRYVPAAETASVGGDWFDSFLQRDGATVLVIGDVMGHDAVAAAAMGQVRGLLRGIAWYSGGSPAEVLSGLDAAMQGLLLSTTATAVVARLEQSLDERERGITRLRWSNAGHPPPMAINPDGSVVVLGTATSDLLLGIDPDTERTESAIVVDRGATVLLYTDGLVERRTQDIDEGLGLLRQALGDLGHLSLNDLCDELLVRMLPGRPEDDVAMVAVRLHRQDRPRPAEAGPQRTPPDVPEEPPLPAG
ncbi:MAG: SpoIIE family protein phosphatase, partial [Actinobacteria bacterium]|nr:SpoIIE family protein phosphatase [Actinomycetota bacterium]